jgi:hypothetical protein
MPFSISRLLSSRETDIGQRALARGSISVEVLYSWITSFTKFTMSAPFSHQKKRKSKINIGTVRNNFLFPWHNFFVNIHVFVLYVILILFRPATHLQFCYAILIGLFDSTWYGNVTVVKVYDHGLCHDSELFCNAIITKAKLIHIPSHPKMLIIAVNPSRRSISNKLLGSPPSNVAPVE